MTGPRILVTGSRHWEDRDRIIRALNEAGKRFDFNPATTLVHGDAPGADTIARDIWHDYGLADEPHPADWSLGKRAGPLRNEEMVVAGADLCLAFPIGKSTGTRHCMHLAQRAGIITLIHEGAP